MNHEQFTSPLPTTEVNHIARSIHQWIITKSRMWVDGPAVYEATFTTIQSIRGKKGSAITNQKRWGGKLRKHVEQLVQEGNNA